MKPLLPLFGSSSEEELGARYLKEPFGGGAVFEGGGTLIGGAVVEGEEAFGGGAGNEEDENDPDAA